MATLRRVVNKPALVRTLLALPAVPMAFALAAGRTSAGDLLHVTGELAAELMIAVMIVTPLRMLFPKARWLVWTARHRRAFGVAAFGYAALHTLFYVVDMETLRNILAEFWALGIWTGWAAVAILGALALTSNDAALRWLRLRWKALHRWVYPAAVLTLVHWIFVDNDFGPALAHFIPLALLETYRIARTIASNKAAQTG